MGTPGVIALVLAVLVLAAVLISLCAQAVGHIADEAGEDRRWWQLMMLPFGVLGPIIAKAVLDRRGGGPGRPA